MSLAVILVVGATYHEALLHARTLPADGPRVVPVVVGDNVRGYRIVRVERVPGLSRMGGHADWWRDEVLPAIVKETP